MNAIDPVVAQFCATLNMPPQRLPLSLQFERSGRLQIDHRGNDYCVLLARPAPQYQEGVAEAALRAVHPDRGLPFSVRAGFSGDDTLVLLARIPDREFDLPTLERLLAALTSLADDATRGRA